MKNFITNKKYLWINILIMIFTYGIWLIVFLYLKNKYKNERDSNKDYITQELKVAGVTFTNEDQTSRQELISNLKVGNKLILQPYIFEGRDSVYVKNAAMQVLGNIPRQNTKEVIDMLTSNKIIKVLVSDINSFKNENNKKIFYLKIRLYIKLK